MLLSNCQGSQHCQGGVESFDWGASGQCCNGPVQGMNLDPSMMNMMKDLDGAEMNKQLETLGLSPSEVINKIMAEPELAAAFQKPKVMQVTQPAPAARRSRCLHAFYIPVVDTV